MPPWCTQIASFRVLDRISLEARRALQSGERDRQEEFRSLRRAAQCFLQPGGILVEYPCFGDFWASIPKTAGGNVELDKFARGWGTLCGQNVSASEELKMVAAADVERRGSISAQQALDYFHALNFFGMLEMPGLWSGPGSTRSGSKIDRWAGHYRYDLTRGACWEDAGEGATWISYRCACREVGVRYWRHAAIWAVAATVSQAPSSSLS